ncbi:unnamed protein product, partial [Mesorhabditis belari]|uniref:FERM domain-containing protein n=1 Tax=Mesorhabditis belari TaxID=2138241 RepID=A0AAF3J3Q3_9BILA
MGIFRFGAKKKVIKVAVQLLDDTETITSEFKRSEPAQAILDYVLETMNIKETDYFGLRYQDHDRHRYWVDLSKPISHMAKQFKFPDTLTLRLRFRFYPNDPHMLREEITRYQLFVQLQRDLLHGRLYCPQGTAAHLAALVLQSQLGDYDEAIHGELYASKYKLLLKQTPKIEEKIEELHREMSGKCSASEAELEFLERACELDTYGFDPYTVKDRREPIQSIFLGATHRGVIIYKGNVKAHQIEWKQLVKVDYLAQELRLTPTDDYIPPTSTLNLNLTNDETQKEKMIPLKEKRKSTIKFLCPNQVFAKHLWTHILSQQAFFTDASASTVKQRFSKPRIPLLGRGSSFSFPSRRVLHEIEILNDSTPRLDVSFLRYSLPRQEPRLEATWLNKTHQSTLINGHLSRLTEKSTNENISKVETRESLLLEMERLVKEPRNHSEQSAQTQDGNEIQIVPLQIIPTFSTTKPLILENKFTVEEKTSVISEEIGEPLLTSTPTNAQMIRRGNHLTENLPQNSTISPINGHSKINGNSIKKTKSVNSIERNSTQRIVNAIFISLLFLLLFATLMIAFFEHRSTSDWFSSNEAISRIRQHYYEPARKSLIALYARVIPQR